MIPEVAVGFNPSVGILFVHTGIQVEDNQEYATFQSLGRDSVCSYMAMIHIEELDKLFQSLGRDSVCSYQP